MKKFFILLFALIANAGMLLADSDVIFSESFSSSKGNFTISNKQIPSNLSYIWQWKSANYGMVASAFASGTAYASESWLISPTISLEDCTSATLSFDHALNKGASTNLRVKISVDNGSTWSDLSISQWPAGTNWTFINATASLDAYVGNSIQIAFVYKSTTTICPQWEIKNFKVSGTVNDNGGTGTSYSHVKIGELYYNLDTINLTAEVISENEEYPYWSTNISSVNIPSSVTYNSKTYSVTSIGEYAFAICTGLTSVTFPNSVTGIGEYAFAGCTGLTSITIPSNVTSIGGYAFAVCSGLTAVIWNAKHCNDFSSESTPFYNKEIINNHEEIEGADISEQITSLVFGKEVEYIPAYLCVGLSQLSNIIIPNSVTSIGDYAFSGCRALSSVTIGNSVSNIGNYAFSGCRGLSSITIPGNVTSIGESAFSYCTGLTSVVWNAKRCNDFLSGNCTPFYRIDGGDIRTQITSFVVGNAVEHIPAYLCFGMSQLNNIVIPQSVTSIGNHAFYECGGLNKVNITDLAGWCNITFGDNSSNPLAYAKHLYVSNSEITNLIIPNSVTNIGDYAFYNCTGLTSVTFPNSVTGIGEYAFAGCTGLTSVAIPNSVDSVKCGTFAICTGLTSVTIPNSVTDIGEYAFSYCTGLTSVTIPNSVTSIPKYAFSNCTGLISTTIPGSVTSIGEYAFYYCSGLSSVTMEKGCDSIGDYAFCKCGKIKTITLPSTLTYIGENAFDTESILDVYDYATTPQDMSVTNYHSGYGLTLLRGVLASARLHVPQQSIDLYKEAYYWCYFGTITPLETSEPEAINPVFNGDGSSLNSSDRKILRNGQIYILRGDRTYTLTGQDVK